MLVTCRRVLRVERSLRFFSVNLEQVPNDKIDGMQDDDYVVDQSFDVQRIRRDEDKSLRIAILGLPNAGKSTLVNQLAGRQICAMSGKAHTTRSKTNVIYSESNTQLIFMDTPGLVTNRDFKKFKLEPTFKSDITQSLELADVVGVVQDVSNPFKRHKIDERVIEALKCTRPGVFSILILNKIDRMRRKKELLKLVDILTGENNWPNFSDIFMISALKNDGVDDLRAYLMDSATNRDWDYRSNQITDESTEKIVERTVKAKFMDALPDELPYVLDIQTEHLGVLPDDSMSAVVNVDCPTDRIGKLVMGPKGSRVKQVALAAEQDLSNAFRTTQTETVELLIDINGTVESTHDDIACVKKDYRLNSIVRSTHGIIDVPMGENRLKLISNMKIVFFCFLPFVAADGISAKNLYEYVTISSGIRQHMQSVSQYLHIIDSGSRDVTDIIYKNISQVLAHYGPKKHLHFISKYEPQAVDFAGNQNLSADCRQYIIDLIEESKQHQHELSEYVEKALGSFIEELERIHKKFHWAESILTDIEKKVFNCGFFSETADAIDSYNCALDTLKTMEILKIDITNVVVTDALSLLSAKRKILDNLHQSLSDRFIPEFYNEKGRDRWLKIFCPND